MRILQTGVNRAMIGQYHNTSGFPNASHRKLKPRKEEVAEPLLPGYAENVRHPEYASAQKVAQEFEQCLVVCELVSL